MIVIDFETYSPTPISAGSQKYASDPGADIVCMAYKVDEQETELWLPGQGVPIIFFEKGQIVYAHNAGFDYAVWEQIATRKHGFPHIPLSHWVDSAALANRYTLPAGLAAAGAILKIEIQKGTQGKALIRKICIPNKFGDRPQPLIDFTYAQLAEFYQYCIDDVNSTYELIRALPSSKLSSVEQEIWELTQNMNMAGLPIDIEAAERIHDYIEGYVSEMSLRVPEISNGVVQKATQVKRIRDWMEDKYKIETKNLNAVTVIKLLQQDLPEVVREMLELRQAIGRSSTAKYKKIKEMELNGRVYNNLQYYGAGTGRWAGRGFQLQNLPRASVPDPENAINKFINFEPVDDPVNVAKALIRPMIKAPEGYHLIVSDFKAIEYRVLSWLAGEEWALVNIRNGIDAYRDQASFLFQVKYSDISASQRLVGKIIILGCGFMMAGPRFQETAKDQWGIDIALAQSMAAVESYREKYALVKKLWYSLKSCAIQAIQDPGGGEYIYRGCIYRVVKCRNGNRWLVVTIPSGRKMFYMEPSFEPGKFGMAPHHWGINPYSKKWSKLQLSPGRLTENIIQGLARDIMANGLLTLQAKMPTVSLIGTNHDEGIGLIHERHINKDTMDTFNHHICAVSPWAEGLPLEAEGYIEKRYRK